MPGEHLDQPTFHARYEAMPEDFRAELIGGIVFMASPVGSDHARFHSYLMEWLLVYRAETPGIEALVNPTIILGPEDEPEPDACLIVVPGFGGKTRTERGVIAGSPELVVEVASSSLARDLDIKRRSYERNGVGEYLVIAVTEPQVFWFARKDQVFDQLVPGPDGIYRSPFFAGLWLDSDALLRLDRNRVVEVLRQGLASPEHAEFVKRLAEQRASAEATK